MKIAKVLFLLAVSTQVLASCRSGDSSTTPTRRHASALTGTGDAADTTGVLLLDLSAASATATVGKSVVITAQGWLNSAKTTPVTAGTDITFSRLNNNGTLSAASASADSSGKATVSLSSSAPGDVTVTASIDKLDSSAVVVAFSAPPIVPGAGGNTASDLSVVSDKAVLTVNDNSALNLGDQATLTINVAGSNVSTLPVKVSATSGSLSSNLVTPNASGVATVTYTAGILAEDAIITVTSGSLSSTATIIVTPGVPKYIEVSDPAPASLGLKGSGSPESSVVTFTVKDRYGNLVSDSNVVSFSLSPALTGATVSPPSMATNHGVISAVVDSGTQSGTMNIVATVGGVTVSSGNITIFSSVTTPIVDVVSVSSSKTNVTVYDGNAGNSGDQATITVTVRDQDGAVMSGIPVRLSSTSGSLASNFLTTDISGTVSTTFTAGVIAEDAVITAVADGKNGVSSVSVLPGDAFFLEVAAPSPALLGLSGSGSPEYSIVPFTVKDQYGNLVSDGTVVSFALSPVLTGATVSPSSMTTSKGVISPIVHAGSATGTMRLVATVSGFGNPSVISKDIEVSAGVPTALSVTPSKTSVTVYDGAPANTGDQATVVISLRNEHGNGIAGEQVQLTTSSGSLSSTLQTTDINGDVTVTFTAGVVSGRTTITALAAGLTGSADIMVIPGTPFVIEVAAPSPNELGMKGSGAPENSVVTFTVRDEYGNLASDSTVVNFSLSPVLAGATVSPASMTTLNGVISPIVHSGTVYGSMRLLATIPGNTATVTSPEIVVSSGTPTTIKLVSTKTNIEVFDDSPSSTLDEDGLEVTVLNEYGIPMEGVDVRLSIVETPELTSYIFSPGSLSAQQLTTDSFGKGTLIYTAGTNKGNILFKAEVVDAETGLLSISDTATVYVRPGAPARIMVEGPSTTMMGLLGSSLPDFIDCVFRVEDKYTNHVTDGTIVNFSLVPALAGATVLPASQGTLDGIVREIIHSGTVTGTMHVLATVGSITATTPEITVSSGTQNDVASLSLSSDKSDLTVYDDSSVNMGDQATITVTVRDQNDVSMSGVPVSLSATSGNLSSTLLTTNGAGEVTVTYTAGILAENAIITATTANGKTGTLTLPVSPGAAFVIEMGTPTPALLGLQGSGSPESSIVAVAVKDKYGNMVSDNTVVTFSLVPALAGASVAPVTITTNKGIISPVVHSGTASGTMRLVATTGSRSVISSEITVEGIAATQVTTLSVASDKTSITVNDGDSLNTGDQATITVTVRDRNGVVMPGITVNLSSSAGSLTDSVLVSDVNGTVSTTYSSGILAENVVITAEAEGISGTMNLIVGPGAPFRIEVGEPIPSQLGVKGSGSPESSIIQLTIKDQSGNPVSNSTVVTFQLQPSLGGATVSPVSATTHDGSISAVVNSGTKSGTVRLVATVGSSSVTSGKITIFGGLPSADRFEFVVESGKRVMSGFVLSGLKAVMTIFMADTYGNPAQPGTSVYVACETGLCGSNSQPGIQVDDNGSATFVFETAFSNLIYKDPLWPTAKEDFGGYVGTNHTWSNLKDRRNGYVSVIALATGQSGYDDLNGNNVYDAGFDTITADPSEPYLDIDSSGAYSDGSVAGQPVEDFWDFDVNGTFDNHLPKTYHSQQYIWSENTIIYATAPNLQMVPQQFIDLNGDGIFDADTDLAAVGGPAPADDLGLAAALPGLAASYPLMTLRPGYASFNTSSTTISVSFSDENDNPLPMGSKLALTASDTVSVNTPPGGALEYGADYFFPKAPVDIGVTEAIANRAIKNGDSIFYCAEITVSDSGKYARCMQGIQF